MNPGDTRTIFRTDGVAVTITRTTRSYAQDYATALNSARSDIAKDNELWWMVAPGGGVNLKQNRGWTDNHTAAMEVSREAERERWKHRQNHQVNEEMDFG